jgi:hypothetical protein
VDVRLYHLQKLLESTSFLQTLIIRQEIMFDRKEVVRIMEAGIWKNRASLENWRGLAAPQSQ